MLLALAGLAPYLLANFVYAGSAGGATADWEQPCLPDAIPEGSRRFLLDGGRELPLGVWALEWSSGWLLAWIYRILAGEVLGFRTVIDSGVTSSTSAYALAGCRAPKSKLQDAGCEGAASPEFHVALEAWMNVVDERMMSALGARVGSRLPWIVGSVGYEGNIFFSVIGETFQTAWNGHGVALDYYRSYNRTWHEPSVFFASGSDFNNSELQLCTVSRISRPLLLQGYLAATGDEGGVIRTADGQLTPRCFDGVWWRSPACRDAPEKCVPLITGGDGYDIQFLMSSTSHLGMPVQVATAVKGLWPTLPLRGKGTLFYWWFPDETFATLEAKKVILPPHDKDEWDRGVQTTSGSDIMLGKLAAASLEAAAPKALRLLQAFSLSPNRISQILTENVRRGETYYQSACAWLRANEDVWRPWIPLETTCSAGEGVVDSAGHFVDNASLAVSCERCEPGCFSDVLGSGATHTYRCRACPTGSFSNHFGATHCSQCPPGTMSASPQSAHGPHLGGSDSCARCPVGTFQPSYGSSACVDCSVWLLGAETPFVGAEHASDCRCPEGSHRLRAAPGLPHRCVACGDGEGLLCPAGLGVPRQDAGFFAHEAPVVEEQDAEMLRLSNGAAGGSVLTSEPKIMRCESPTRCAAGLVLGRCPPHQELLACDGCEVGFVWQGTSCESCSGGDWVRIVTAAAVAAILGAAAAYVGTRLSSAGHFDSRAFLTSLGLGVHCLQAVSSISLLNVEWVEPMVSLKRFLQLLNLNITILRIGCFFQTNSVVLEYVAGLVLPLYFFGVVLATFGVLRLLGKRVKWSHVMNALGSTLMLLFLSMAMAAFVPFQCIGNPDGTSSVSSMRSVICWRGQEHAALLGLATVASALYVALPIAVVAAVTAQYPRRMVQPGWQEFAARWNFAFNRFTRRCYFFGVFYMLRNFAIAVIPLTSADSTQVQILLLVGMTALSVSIQSLLQPWCTRLANVLDTATGLILITVLLGSAMLLPNLDEGEISILQAVFVIVTVGICLVCASPIVWMALEKAARGEKYAFFLTHFKDEAACRARYWKLVISTNFPRSRVFLDSDNLQDMDALFDTVARRTRQLVVIVTPGVLARPWCAGEIAVAHQHRVPFIPIVFKTAWPPPSEAIDAALVGLGPRGTQSLNGKGISLVQIRDAYKALAEAPPVLVEELCEDSYDWAIHAMLGCTGRRLSAISMTPSQSTPSQPSLQEDSERSLGTSQRIGRQQSTAEVGILASVKDPEAVAARGILGRMLPARSVGKVSALPVVSTVECADLHCFRSAAVLLSGGALRDRDFAAGVELAVDAGISLIPVKVHKDFEYPDAAFYQQLEAGLVFGPDADASQGDLVNIRFAYERLFRIISVTLTPSAPMPVLEAEVAELSSRLRSALHQPPPSTSPFRSSTSQGSGSNSHSLTVAGTASGRAAAPEQTAAAATAEKPGSMAAKLPVAGVVEEAAASGTGSDDPSERLEVRAVDCKLVTL